MNGNVLAERLAAPQGATRMVLDTDTYNEVDDQFALAYALLSPDSMTVEAVYAAPFHNSRSSGPEDGMEKSYEEIINLIGLLGMSCEGLVHRGSRSYLASEAAPVDSPAARDLVARAMASDDVLYVVAIGAITNVASAILLEPAIIDRIVVVWLGGHAPWFAETKEFNLGQDVAAARVVFDSGVPLVRYPCRGVVSHVATTVPELDAYLKGQNDLCDYLADIVREYNEGRVAAWSKVIWDVAAVSWLVDAGWTESELLPSPTLNDDVTWGAVDSTRHVIRSATFVNRDAIFRDLFRKLVAAG